MTHELSRAKSLENLRKLAKRWLKLLRQGDAEARGRLDRAYPEAPANPALRDVQHAVARESGHDSWVALKAAVEKSASSGPAAWPTFASEQYAEMAADLVRAFNDRDEVALRRLNERYRREFTFEDLWAEIWRRVYAFRQRSFGESANRLCPAEAQTLVAQDAGFGSWAALISAPSRGVRRVPPFSIDAASGTIAPRRQLSEAEWDELLGVMKERRLRTLQANGQMTDAVLDRVADLEHVTGLALEGSGQVSDQGLAALARMPQLERLNISQHPGGRITDRGLGLLRHLTNLRDFEMTWRSGVSDAGLANLRHCDRLERVDLMGSLAGDGVIAALEGKPALREFKSGRLVTDAGLRMLGRLPRLRDDPYSSADESGVDRGRELGASVLIDGPITDAGLASLADLAGVVELDLFWHVKRVTANGFAHLVAMPNLGALGADGALTDDVAMGHIGAMPRLRRLRAQESTATDEGFEALARSRTLEHLWGRVCTGFSSRGFLALAQLPALRSLGIGCKNVDDTALAALPEFPALHDLTPIDFRDEGFRHVGRCQRLERMTCMYCRATTDRATEHMADLPLRYYYAGLTGITDRSLDILGRMDSLEHVELYECAGPTDAGLAALAQLPGLREVQIEACPGVTYAGTHVFAPRVRVNYAT